MNFSAAATLDLAKELSENRISLARLFAESIKSVRAGDMGDDFALRKACSENMASRVAEKLKIAEDSLKYVNFGIFFDECAKALRPIRLRDQKNSEIKLVMPLDIKKVANDVAGRWHDENALAMMMSNCARTGDGSSLVRAGEAVSVEPVKPAEKSSALWSPVRKFLKGALKMARNITAGVLLMTTFAASWNAIQVKMHPESPAPVLAELGSGFGLEAAGMKPRKVWKQGMEKMAHDGDFDQLLQDDNNLKISFALLKGMEDDPARQVEAVNKFWNSFPAVQDEDNYGRDEYWAGASEMWQNGGDCEDYAIAKYVTLRKLGFSADDLHVLHTTMKNGKGGHAILAVKVCGEYKVLDNLHEDSISVQQAASEYRLGASINEKGATQYFRSEDSAKTSAKTARMGM